jgi:hypothetical protein
MKQMQQRYIHSNELIEYYFVSFKENIDSDVIIDGDLIYVKGVENCMNILKKTFVALHYLINVKQKHYEYIVRTNVSTIFNYNVLLKYLNSIPSTDVYLGNILHLNWIDEKFGITNFKRNLYSLTSLMFFQGTCIIMSYDVVKNITENMINLKYDIIDDVAIALYIRTFLPKAYLCSQMHENPQVTCNTFSEYSVCIRNRVSYENNNRETEIINMNRQIGQIYKEC